MRITPKKEIILEDGWYSADIGEIEEEKQTIHGEKLFMPFTVHSDKGDVAIDAFISYSDHPKSNLVKFAKGLFGDRVFETSEFSDQSCEVFLEEKENDAGETKNYIRKLRKPKGTGKAESKVDESDFDDLPL